MHVRFSEPFDWTPPAEQRVTVAYPIGDFTVTRDCADAAVKAGKATRIKPPKRGDYGASGREDAGSPEVPTQVNCD